MSLFDDTPADQQGAPSAPEQKPADNSNDQLLDLVTNEAGERKYNNLNDLAKGAAHAQGFITDLKAEVANLKAALEKSESERTQMQEIVDLLRNGKGNETPAQAAASEGLTPEQVSQLIQNALTQRDSQSLVEANVAKVAAAAEAQFGSSYKSKMKELATSRGLSIDAATQLAETNPDFLIASLGLNAKPSSRPSVQSTTQPFTEQKATTEKFDLTKPKASEAHTRISAARERVAARLANR